MRPTKRNFGASTPTTRRKIPLVWIMQYMDDYKPSKPISPCVLEPSKLLLATNFVESFLHLAYWSHHRWAANEKQQKTWIWFGSTKFPALQQTHNTKGLVMEMKVTNFSQGYVICESKGGEDKEIFFFSRLRHSLSYKRVGMNKCSQLSKPTTTPTANHHHQNKK